jgi:hypothetical protein
MGDILRNTASTQIDDYQQRFSAVSEFYDLLFKDLIVDKCNKKAAYETAKKFFDKYTASFVAIDDASIKELDKWCIRVIWKQVL